MIQELVFGHPTFIGMPWRKGRDCQIARADAEKLATMSKKVRTALVRADSKSDEMPGVQQRYGKFFSEFLKLEKEWKKPEATRLLVQILEGEGAVYRMMLVELLQKIEGKESTQALAKRAVFDVDERIRARALKHLRSRSAGESRPVLVAGFRHIWPPAAQNAAEALKTLRDMDALKDLVAMIDAPEPSRPFVSREQGNVPVVPELVRLNHNLSCVICHAAAEENRDTPDFVFVVPPSSRLLPTFPSVEYYFSGNNLVRLDTTYLRQDFSVNMSCRVVDTCWSGPQRYDFITRLRPATEKEIAASAKPKSGSYPQREAILDVLRSLTGKDGGDNSLRWDRIVGTVKR